MSLNILIADDIQNRSDSKKYKRSVLIRNTAAQFAEKLNDNVDFIFVEDYKKIRSKEEMARMEKEHDINLTLMNDLKDFFP